MTPRWLCAPIVFILFACGQVQAGLSTYIALGDSLAFGVGANDSSTDISNGDRGYVGAFDNVLASRQGGVRPNLFNLAISGETSNSFFQIGAGLGGLDATLRNTHYTNTLQNPPVSQNSLLLSTIAGEKLAGNTISQVTIQLGGNDIGKLAQDPNFFTLTPSQQQALVLQTLGTVQANDTAILTELKTLAPSAQLILMGIYDPYAPFRNDPTSPFFPISQASQLAVPALNQVIAGEAAALGAVYVDEFSPFVGNELAYTYIASGNLHPDAAGYAAITSQLVAATTVPEPPSLAMLVIGLVSLLGHGWRNRRTVA